MTANGVLIHDTLSVDLWRNPSGDRFYFLSHLHSDHLVGLNRSWNAGPIYTSPTNAGLLPTWPGAQVDPRWIRPLELDQEHVLVQDGRDGQTLLSVTLLDAHHVPGAVMFLFKGVLGTILVTGDFRNDQRLTRHPVLEELARTESLDALYLDNTFLNPSCSFSSRAIVMKKLIGFVRDHPEDKIWIGLKKLGKESALVQLALALREKICVSREKYRLFQKLELKDVFTMDPGEARISVVDPSRLNRSNLDQENQNASSSIQGILLSALYFNWPGGPYSRSQEYGLHVFEYSDHSSYNELLEFVDDIKPKSVFPIVTSVKGFTKERPGFADTLTDMSVFDPFLSEKAPAVPEPSLLRSIHRVKCLSRPGMKRPRSPRVYRGPMGVQYQSSSSSSSGSGVQVVSLPASGEGDPPCKFLKAALLIESILETSFQRDTLDQVRLRIGEALSLAEEAVKNGDVT